MDRKRPSIDSKKIRGIENDSFKRVRRFYNTEVEPIIKSLYDKEPTETFKESMKKFLVVMLFSSLEHFFRSEVKFVVDKNDLDIKSLFDGNITFSLDDLDRMQKEGSLTEGNIVASNFNFGNLTEINHVCSHLLNLDFLDYVHKLNDIDQTRYVLHGRPIPLNYGKLIEAYQLRNEIVHEFKDTRLSNNKILSLWDNAMNMIDISVAIFLSTSDEDLRSTLDSDYQWGIEREKRKKLYDLYSPLILKYLDKNVMSELTEEGKLNNHIFNEIKIKKEDKTLIEYTAFILRRMQRKKLIKITDNKIYLTSEGKERAIKLRKLVKLKPISEK